MQLGSPTTSARDHSVKDKHRTMTDRIAVIGGTGALGNALATRWADSGLDVVIGSRDRERALEVAGQMSGTVAAMENREAAAAAQVVVLTVPFSSHAATIESIKNELGDKLLVDTTVPLVPPRVAVVQLPDAGSAAVAAQQLVGESVRVTSAFHNVAATKVCTAVRLQIRQRPRR